MACEQMVNAYGVNLFTVSRDTRTHPLAEGYSNTSSSLKGPLTLGVVAYNALSPIFAASLYNCWVALGLEIFTLIMWLVSFAILASYTASFQLYLYGFSYYYKRSLLTYSQLETAWQTGAAASGIGGLELWVSFFIIIIIIIIMLSSGGFISNIQPPLFSVLWIITLVVFGIYLHRHRASNGQSPPVYSAPANDYKQAEAQAQVQQAVLVQQPYATLAAAPQQYGSPPPNPQQQYQAPPPTQQYAPQPVQEVQQPQPPPQQYAPPQQQYWVLPSTGRRGGVGIKGNLD
jgi:small-conductance mechanosensitive channel